MIRDSNKMKYNLFVFCLNVEDTKNKKMNDANTKKLKGTLKKTKITKGHDLVSEPRSDINWCEPRDHATYN